MGIGDKIEIAALRPLHTCYPCLSPHISRIGLKMKRGVPFSGPPSSAAAAADACLPPSAKKELHICG